MLNKLIASTTTSAHTHLLAVMLKGASNVASSFFIVVMSKVRSRQLLVATCKARIRRVARAARARGGKGQDHKQAV